MKGIVGLGNLLLLALNLSALGTITYKGQLWQPGPSEESSPPAALLNLSPTQTEAMEMQRAAFMRDWEKFEPELLASRGSLLEAIRRENPDPEQLSSLIENITRLQSQMELQAVERLMQEKEILTPQQNEQYFSQLENQMRRGVGRMRGYRGGRGAWPERSGPAAPSRKGGKGQGRSQRGRW